MEIKELLNRDMGSVIEWLIDNESKFVLTPLITETEPVAEVPCSVGLSDELINAIEQMAVAINLAPDDNPCITMHPKIWLLWETILFKAGIEPGIDEGR